jgi:hypothetical protein
MYYNLSPTATTTSNRRKTFENGRKKLNNFLLKWFMVHPNYRTMAVPNGSSRPDCRVELRIPGEQCHLWFFLVGSKDEATVHFLVTLTNFDFYA